MENTTLSPEKLILKVNEDAIKKAKKLVADYVGLNDEIKRVQTANKIKFTDTEIKNLLNGSFSASKFAAGQFTKLTPKVAQMERDELTEVLKSAALSLNVNRHLYGTPRLDLIQVKNGEILPVDNLDEVLQKEYTLAIRTDEGKALYEKAKRAAADLLEVTKAVGAERMESVFEFDFIYQAIEVIPDWFAESE